MGNYFDKHGIRCLAIVGVIGLGALVTPADSAVRVYSVEKTYGPFRLEGQTLQQTPAGAVPVGFEESVWVVGYSTDILLADGESSSADLHCHTVMSSAIEGLHPALGEPFKGVFSDGFTRRVILPPGFGLYYAVGEHITVMPMFNNRTDSSLDVSMQIKVDFVRAEELPEPLTPLYATTVSVARPYLYMVPPGRDVREQEFSLPYSGSIHAMGVHIHPYGRSIELINRDTGETVWNALGSYGDDGRLIEMPFFSDRAGYAFGPEDHFVLRATYENPTGVEQDAMAGLFIFFATEDGKSPPLQNDSSAMDEVETHSSADHSGEH